jgi:UDP-N-acetylglucosamine 2-epimerase (non-hydrolysing)
MARRLNGRRRTKTTVRSRGRRIQGRNDILVVFGTRPEAIKMAPVIKALHASKRLAVRVCLSGQHRQILDPILQLFDIAPDFDLNVMEPNQSLDRLMGKIAFGFGKVLEEVKPSLVLVQGDTTTTMVAAVNAFYRNVPVGHIEAGLRSGKMHAPWPEEFNRRVTALATRFHFAATNEARANLLGEGILSSQIYVTGNTVVDALRWVAGRIANSPERGQWFEDLFGYLDPRRRVILVTSHRRENFGDGLRNICRAIRVLAARSDVQIVYPVHPNPNVRDVVHGELAGLGNVFLIDPVGYESFVYLMSRSYVLLTDSGGIQEEGPSLGRPVLVLRETTERPEAILTGSSRLVGLDVDRIVGEVERILDDQSAYGVMARASDTYGNGTAAACIRATLEREL